VSVQTPAEPIAVGPFFLDIANHRLLRDGVEVKLRPQAFQALHVLVQNSGHEVDYHRMIQEAWAGTCVSGHTVEVTVAEVKKALGEHGFWITRRPKLGYRLEVPGSDELIRSGWHFLGHRTREGFERALACFQQAALENGGDFRAFEGLAQSYLILGVYGMRPPRQMYGGFRQAHARAVALIGWTPELRWMHAHGLHMFERRFDDAEAEFLQALQEKPYLAPVYARLAMLYATQGRLDEALEVLLRGHKIDPLYPALPATEVFLRLCRREFAAAVDCGKRSVELHPYLELGRTFYAQALEHSGRMEEALAQYQTARVICPDSLRLRALEGACLARTGRRRKAALIMEALDRARASEYVDAYFLTLLLDALGHRDQALRELERAIDENSAGLYMLDLDPNMDPLRRDPRFIYLRNRLFRGTGPSTASSACNF
jgi:tetratricopeptide (TPR) repeat protein/DNA-binding winged helix-turn-helix (wHTH) protein